MPNDSATGYDPFAQPPCKETVPLREPGIADPRNVRKNYIQEEDVRTFMGDSAPHDLLGGYAFSSDDIHSAMRFATMAYNELPPHGFAVQVDTMPFSYTFLHGISAQLYGMKVRQLSHELLNYSVGDIQYTDKETRMKAYQAKQNDSMKEFTEMALNEKRRQNLEAGYDVVLSAYSYWNR